MESSKHSSIIENLKNVYKLDLTLILNDVLNKENFIDQYPLVFEIFNSLINENNLKLIQDYSDRILEFCMLKFQFQVDCSNKQQSLVLVCDKLDLVLVEHSEETLFNYLKLSFNNCSDKIVVYYFKIYLIYFMKIAIINKFTRSNKIINDALNLSENFLKDVDSTDFRNPYGLKQINLLNKLFNLITSKLKSIDLDLVSDKLNILIEFLLENSLEILNKVSDESYLVKLCINNLTKLASISEHLKTIVLDKVYNQLKFTNENELTTSQAFGYLNKKRVESFVQDINLNLITSLADFIFDKNNLLDDKKNFLNKLEYWNLIQNGLAHTNSLTRKQALYLLKRTNDFGDVNKIDIKSDYYEVFNTENVYLYKSSSKIWNDFYLIIELLEETSVHIIKPSLAKLNNILASIKQNEFHYSWLFVLLSRAFLHESKYIVRWAVNTFLNSQVHLLIENISVNFETNRKSVINSINNFILKPFLVTIQKSHIFKKSEDSQYVDSCPKSAILLSDFLRSYLNILPNQKLKVDFLETFTKTLNNYSWNATCLMFVTKALYELDENSTFNLNSEIVKNIHKIITCALTTQEILLRSSTQTFLIKFLAKHIQVSKLNEESFKNMIDIINSLSNKECLVYHNSTWYLLIDWFKNALMSKENKILIKNYIENEFKSFSNDSNTDQYSTIFTANKLAKTLIILLDTNEESVFNSTLELILDRINSCNKYAYRNTLIIEKTIFTFNSMVDYIRASNFADKASNSYQLIQVLYNKVIIDIIDYIIRKSNLKNEQGFLFDDLFNFVDLIKNLLCFSNDSVEYKKTVRPNLWVKISKTILSDVVSTLTEISIKNSFAHEWKKCIHLAIFTALANSNFSAEILKETILNNNNSFISGLLNLKSMSKSNILSLRKDLPDSVFDNILENYSIFNGKFCELLWLVYGFILRDLESFMHIINDEKILSIGILLDRFKNFSDLTSSGFLSSLVRSANGFKYLINKNEMNRKFRTELVELLRILYKQIWEIHEDVKNFYEVFNEFLKILLSKELLDYDEDDLFKNLIKDICQDVIKRGNEKTGVGKPLANCFFNFLIQFKTNVNEFFIDIIISFLIYGDVYRKEKKYIRDIEMYVESLGKNFGTNQLIKADYLNDSAIRMKALNYYMSEESLLTERFYTFLLDNLIEKDKRILSGNFKLYINSLVHRERFRIWQTIITLFQKLDSKNYDMLLEYGEQCLITETQPSIRILIEWVITKVILAKIDDFDLNLLFDKLKNFSSKKVGYTSSWLTILTNLAPLLKNNSQKINYLNNLLPIILSQILSSNFHIRTYVEATLIKLNKLLNEVYPTIKTGLNEPEIVENEKVKILSRQINSIIGPSLNEKDRHANILISHFYFQFDPLEDYSIETVYFWLPYLSGLIEEELVRKENFLSIILDKPVYELNSNDYELKFTIPLNNGNSKLKNCIPGVWKFSALKDDTLYEPTVSVEDLQKKIIPWHVLMPNQEDLDNVNRKKTNLSNEGLILVSSLIDKGTNLGGISRTCEIFNVKELIVGNIRYLEDKLFQNLSVTSEKWLNIKEVSVKHLKTFLLEMKYNGHVLVGLEQTANSVQMNEFSFPLNTVLILGNEKEGIPVDIIQMLDYCVEIPQLGVIRSLNVHVSAALAIWEYTKQHSLK